MSPQQPGSPQTPPDPEVHSSPSITRKTSWDPASVGANTRRRVSLEASSPLGETAVGGVLGRVVCPQNSRPSRNLTLWPHLETESSQR